ncbi:MAG TPA: sugar phosphate isomerase/epimerase [Fimbriimonadaceae bacterium]|nr:sugar phosphate isomerase/epimerase [Fimbriimonadaceae bacterium]
MATSRENHQDIRIGTMAELSHGAAYLRQILPHGFESFQLTNWQYLPKGMDLERTGKEVLEAIADKAVISTLGLYGNPLQDEENAKDWERIIKACKYFDTKMVCGFAGAIESEPVDASMPVYKKVFGRLAKIAEDEGVRIGFENCDMGGTWDRPRFNIAHSPRAWEMMFNEVPSKAIGLEWEPCHQMVSLIDPLPQLRKWVDRVVHIHGKDATVCWDVLKTEGLRSGKQIVYHRTPGFGDTNWTDVITILRMGGFVGSIDVEGWHDPVYRAELEMTGQVHAMNYLKNCRGGAYVPNPVVAG